MEWSDDWSDKISDDQVAMNEYLLPLTAGARILHVGIGNSSLARQARDARLIIGTTIIPSEIIFAKSLLLTNYLVHLIDKHSENMFDAIEMDFIVDNNPFAFCKDEFDLFQILDTYSMLLNSDGQIVSHKKGIIWNFTKLVPCKTRKDLTLDADGNYTLDAVEKIIEANGLKLNYLKNGIITITG